MAFHDRTQRSSTHGRVQVRFRVYSLSSAPLELVTFSQPIYTSYACATQPFPTSERWRNGETLHLGTPSISTTAFLQLHINIGGNEVSNFVKGSPVVIRFILHNRRAPLKVVRFQPLPIHIMTYSDDTVSSTS